MHAERNYFRILFSRGKCIIGITWFLWWWYAGTFDQTQLGVGPGTGFCQRGQSAFVSGASLRCLGFEMLINSILVFQSSWIALYSDFSEKNLWYIESTAAIVTILELLVHRPARLSSHPSIATQCLMVKARFLFLLLIFIIHFSLLSSLPLSSFYLFSSGRCSLLFFLWALFGLRSFCY